MLSRIVKVFRVVRMPALSKNNYDAIVVKSQKLRPRTPSPAYLGFSRLEYHGTRRFWVSMKFEYRRKALGFVDSRRDTWAGTFPELLGAESFPAISGGTRNTSGRMCQLPLRFKMIFVSLCTVKAIEHSRDLLSKYYRRQGAIIFPSISFLLRNVC